MKSPTELFIEAEQFLCHNGFGDEIIWCENRPSFETVDARQFLTEYAWVVFNSGMKNSVIEAKWEALTHAFFMFERNHICGRPNFVRKNVLAVFGNERKVDAVIEMAKKLCSTNLYFTQLKEKIQKNPLDELEKFKFIGPVTKHHLARNLGFDFVKPDRHLVRLASKYGMTPFEFCDLIHKETGRRLGVIDVILWRFMEQKGQEKLT